MDRRHFLNGMGALGLAALPMGRVARAAAPLFDPVPPLVPIRALPDRLFRITVCLRPFRAAGPRIEAEQVGRKRVIHNYGHGGSGWSLCWGSAEVAVKMAMEAGARDIAVIGAGAIGLTTAIMAQRAGATVTIYAREQFPDVRSARATGSWTPDSRVAMSDGVDAGFAAHWEAMARASFAMHQSFLGSPGDPVEWTERYSLSDVPRSQVPAGTVIGAEPVEPVREFVRLEHRLADIMPRSQILPPGSHPFPTAFARRNSALTFNVAGLARQLTSDFLIAGGHIVPMEFHAPEELKKLKQGTIINCTGYGARALWRDESIVPVRGQIAWLLPQEGAHYGIFYHNVGLIARRDGIVVQDFGPDEWFGYNDADETPDRAAAEAAVAKIAELYTRPPLQPLEQARQP